MASNYTTNFGLCQWEATDQVQRTEFNVDNAKIDAALGEHAQKLNWLGNCRIETGSYVGTGKYGEEQPIMLTFSGKPLAVMVGGWENTIIMVRSTASYIYSMGISTNYLVFPTWGEASLSWYAGAVAGQCNMVGKTYTYLAFLT